jgi:hypothetical protein
MKSHKLISKKGSTELLDNISIKSPWGNKEEFDNFGYSKNYSTVTDFARFLG